MGGAGLVALAQLFTLALLVLLALISIVQGAFAFSKKAPSRTVLITILILYITCMMAVLQDHYVTILDKLGFIFEFTIQYALLFLFLYIYCVAFFIIGSRARLIIIASYKLSLALKLRLCCSPQRGAGSA